MMNYDDSTKIQKKVDICHFALVRPCTCGVPEFCREKFKFSFV